MNRNDILADPLAWADRAGANVPRVGLEHQARSLEAARIELTRVVEESRALSRTIGERKRAQAPFDDLIERKKILSRAERSARDRVAQLEDAILTAVAADADAQPASASVGEGSGPRSAERLHREAVTAPRSPHDLEIRSLEQVSDTRWDAYVSSRADASNYHRAAWAGIIARAFRHRTAYLCALHDDRIAGVLPAVQLQSRLFGNFMVSMPFLNYGGVLADSNVVDSALRHALEALALERGCSHVEYRETTAPPDYACWSGKVCMWLDLPDSVDALHRQLGTKVRAQIKKSRRSGLRVRVGGQELLNDFYDVFAANMRDLGTPVYGKAWFRSILEAAPGDPELVVVDKDGHAVSGALLIAHRERVEVPWASTLRAANRYDANMFLYAALLDRAVARGFRCFDFGRSTPGSNTWRFKKQWGAYPVESHWCYWLREGTDMPSLRADNPRYSLAIGAWQRLPVWATRLLGPAIVRNIP